jgi:hypothetical protein
VLKLEEAKQRPAGSGRPRLGGEGCVCSEGRGEGGCEADFYIVVLEHRVEDNELKRTYDKNKYEREKREALDLWANHLMRLAAGARKSNLVPLRA